MTYDPNIGRWLEDDPIGLDAGDMNLYRFVGNDPTNAIDPSGLEMKRLKGESAENDWGKISINLYELRKEDTDEQFPKKWYGDLNEQIKAGKVNTYGVYAKISFDMSDKAKEKFSRIVFLQVGMREQNGKIVVPEQVRGWAVPKEGDDKAYYGWFIDSLSTSPLYGEITKTEGDCKKGEMEPKYGQVGNSKRSAILLDRPHTRTAIKRMTVPDKDAITSEEWSYRTFVIGDNGPGTQKFVLATTAWSFQYNERGLTMGKIDFRRKDEYVDQVKAAVKAWNGTRGKESVGDILYTDKDK